MTQEFITQIPNLQQISKEYLEIKAKLKEIISSYHRAIKPYYTYIRSSSIEWSINQTDLNLSYEYSDDGETNEIEINIPLHIFSETNENDWLNTLRKCLEIHAQNKHKENNYETQLKANYSAIESLEKAIQNKRNELFSVETDFRYTQKYKDSFREETHTKIKELEKNLKEKHTILDETIADLESKLKLLRKNEFTEFD